MGKNKLVEDPFKKSPGEWKDLGEAGWSILELGGQGDCFFFSLAVAIGIPPDSIRRILSQLIDHIGDGDIYQILDGVPGLDDIDDKPDYLSQSYLLNSRESLGDSFVHINFPKDSIKTDDELLLSKFPNGRENMIFLIKLFILRMASEGKIKIITPSKGDIHICESTYQGNLWALHSLMNPLPSMATEGLHGDQITRLTGTRIIPINERQYEIGDRGHAGCLLIDRQELEEVKTHNVFLWWKGRHYQLLAHRNDEGGEDFIKIDGIDGKYKVIFTNDEVPEAINKIYMEQCKWNIRDGKAIKEGGNKKIKKKKSKTRKSKLENLKLENLKLENLKLENLKLENLKLENLKLEKRNLKEEPNNSI